MNLTTDTDLAAAFGLSVDEFHALRRKHKWPHVRMGRFHIRFTDEQIEQIVASMSHAGGLAVIHDRGLTGRSARRSA